MNWLLHRSSYVSGQLELILLVLRRLNLNTGPHDNPSYELLADEVSDLHLPAVGLLVLLQVDVDGETGCDVSHIQQCALDAQHKHIHPSAPSISTRSHALIYWGAWRAASDGICSATDSEGMCGWCNILGIYVAHLVLVSLGDTDDQVVLFPVSPVLPCLPVWEFEDARDVQSGCGQFGE